MIFQPNPVALSLLVPVLISGGLAAYAFTRRQVVGSRVFALLMLALCVWSFFYGVELSCLTLEGMLACTVVEYLGITTIPVMWLILTLLYTGRERMVTLRNVILLFVIPSITIVMVATNPLHYLYYGSISVATGDPFPMIALIKGPWYWVHSAYSYIALLTGTLLLVARLGKVSGVFRNQVIAMLVGVSVPWVVNFLYVGFGLMLFGHVDPTPFAFTVTGLVVAWSIFRYRLFDIMPMAYDTLVDSMEDAVVVLDGQHRIVGYNPAASNIFKLTRADTGRTADVIWKNLPELNKLIASGETTSIEIAYGRQDSAHYYEAYSYNITDRHKHVIGQAISLHDVTDRKQTAEALRASEAKYRLLSEHTADIVWLMDMDLHVTYQSPSSQKQRGFTFQEITELPLEKNLTPESFKLATETFSAGLPKIKADPGYNPVIVLELEYYHKDGSTFWTESKFSIIRDASGTPVSILGEARNITDRKRAEDEREAAIRALQQTLSSMINTMSKIVEIRDPYTAGHQQRVAELSGAIAREMNLPDSKIESLVMAAKVHDIGKIYVPADLLNRPGKLSGIEMGLIKTHVQGSYDVLQNIEFSQPVAQMVFQHHERLDGSGYPNGLKGDKLLLEAKILAVADVVEAMISHRPYRPARGLDQALEEISGNSGVLYDAEVVDVCVKLFKEKGFEFQQ